MKTISISLRVTNSTVKLLLFFFRVTNSKLRNKRIQFELLSRWLDFYYFVLELWTQVKKYQITFEITDWKTEKVKCWSRIIVIRDFFIEMIYYTIHNIWHIGSFFVIINVDLALKRYRLWSWYYSTHGLLILLRFFVFNLLCCNYVYDIYLSMLNSNGLWKFNIFIYKITEDIQKLCAKRGMTTCRSIQL